MRFIQTHSMGSDCTAPYDIVDYQAKTVAEFVNEVLKEEPKEWGCIKVKHETRGFLCCPRIEYRYGKLFNEIPEAWQHQEIEKIESCGGWSRMDYYITTKNITNKPNKIMEKFSFYDYIQMRVNGRRTHGPMQDLVDDMGQDEELAEKENGQEIVDHIKWLACAGAYEALKRFISAYKKYCKDHELEAEHVSIKEYKRW